MARLVLIWSRPYQLSGEEAERWVRAESARLLGLDAVERAELTRLSAASESHAQPWDWMLELHLVEGADARACADGAALRDWLGDLRLLGMRPQIVLAGECSTLHSADH
jgi:hypothetical protein